MAEGKLGSRYILTWARNVHATEFSRQCKAMAAWGKFAWLSALLLLRKHIMNIKYIFMLVQMDHFTTSSFQV